MSNDKHRALSRRTAWLRRAAAGAEDGTPFGFALQIKWGHAITEDVSRLVADGDCEIVRHGRAGRAGRLAKATGKSYRLCRATPKGLATLAETLARHGADFGPVDLIRELDPPRVRKEARARALRTPAEAAALKARVAARVAKAA